MKHANEAMPEQYLSTNQELSAKPEPSRFEVGVLWILIAILFSVTLSHFQTFTSKVDNFGDNGAYLQAASAIQHWDFHNAAVKLFWGLPYLIAAFSWLPVSPRTDLLLICLISSLISVLLAWELWGAWIAGFFAVVSFRWIQVAVLGGAEPLFTALLFASFLASRKERWLVASLFAALATVVRPLGLFALVAIGIALLYRREYKKALQCTALGASIGALYLLPFWIYFHDPLYQFHLYQQRDWQSPSVIGLPFRAIVISLVRDREPWTNVLITMGWILFAFVGLCAMSRKNFREYMGRHQAECIFGLFYLYFIFSYNSVAWARSEFPGS